MRSLAVLSAVLGPDEVRFVQELETLGGRVVLARRCGDVEELLAAAHAGLGRLAVVSADLPGLDRDAVTALAADGVETIAIADPPEGWLAERARALGIGVVTDPDGAVHAVSVAADRIRAGQTDRDTGPGSSRAGAPGLELPPRGPVPEGAPADPAAGTRAALGADSSGAAGNRPRGRHPGPAQSEVNALGGGAARPEGHGLDEASLGTGHAGRAHDPGPLEDVPDWPDGGGRGGAVAAGKNWSASGPAVSVPRGNGEAAPGAGETGAATPGAGEDVGAAGGGTAGAASSNGRVVSGGAKGGTMAHGTPAHGAAGPGTPAHGAAGHGAAGHGATTHDAAADVADGLGASPHGEEAPGSIVAVWGPTGAPGRTTVAVNLAAELAGLVGPAGTLLVDADTYGGTVAQTLGLLDEAPGIAAAARAAGQGVLDAAALALLAPVVTDGLRVLSGISRAARWAELPGSSLDVVWDVARTVARWTVVDCGFGVEDDEALSYDTRAPRRNAATLSALAAADLVVVVGSADPIGVQRLVRALGDLESATAPGGKVVLANRVRASAVGPRPGDLLSTALERYAGVRDLRLVPDDRANLDAAVLRGVALREIAVGSPARKAILALAEDLVDARRQHLAAHSGVTLPRRRRSGRRAASRT